MTAARRSSPGLEALIIGAYVRGLSDRDVASLVREAGLGSVPKSSVSHSARAAASPQSILRPQPGRLDILALFLDATYLPTRRTGAKDGVLAAWGL